MRKNNHLSIHDTSSNEELGDYVSVANTHSVQLDQRDLGDGLLVVGNVIASRGFLWTVLDRADGVLLVAQVDPEVREVVSYCVILPVPPGERNVAGKVMYLKERLPGWEKWGSKAWNHGLDRRGAEAHFRERVEDRVSKTPREAKERVRGSLKTIAQEQSNGIDIEFGFEDLPYTIPRH